MKHYRIVSDYCVVLLSVDAHDVVAVAAPILHWCKGKKFSWFKLYAKHKGWVIEEL